MAFPPVTVAAITGDAIVSNSLEPLARGKSTGVLYSEKKSPTFGRVKREPGRKMRPTWPLSRVLMVLALSLVTLSVPEGEGGSRRGGSGGSGGSGGRRREWREWREKEGVEGVEGVEGEGGRRREWERNCKAGRVYVCLLHI